MILKNACNLLQQTIDEGIKGLIFYSQVPLMYPNKKYQEVLETRLEPNKAV